MNARVCLPQLKWFVVVMEIKLIKCAIKTKYYKFIDIILFHSYNRYCYNYNKLIDVATWSNDQSVYVHRKRYTTILLFSLYFCLNRVCVCMLVRVREIQTVVYLNQPSLMSIVPLLNRLHHKSFTNRKINVSLNLNDNMIPEYTSGSYGEVSVHCFLIQDIISIIWPIKQVTMSQTMEVKQSSLM